MISKVEVPEGLPPKAKGTEVNILTSHYPHYWINLNNTISCTLMVPPDTAARIEVVEATCEDDDSGTFMCPYMIQMGGTVCLYLFCV